MTNILLDKKIYDSFDAVLYKKMYCHYCKTHTHTHNTNGIFKLNVLAGFTLSGFVNYVRVSINKGIRIMTNILLYQKSYDETLEKLQFLKTYFKSKREEKPLHIHPASCEEQIKQIIKLLRTDT